MSCTVVAVPFALFHVIGLLTATTAVSAAGVASIYSKTNSNELHEIAESYENNFQEEVQHIQICNIVEKEFQTAYMDKDILIKTLEEHGVINIEEDYDGKISGDIENFSLTFKKNSADTPYILTIACKQNDNAEDKLNDLNAEYALNVQEDAYLHLLDKLKENNMEIEEEVVEDDNTIVITVNLE